MILLVMIALAMLTLSTIEQRSSRNGNAMAEAKANARLALMFALGDLQKHAGPDKRITATGGITSDSAAHKHVAGVWSSWRPDPLSPPSNYDAVKDGKFLRWLLSDPRDGVAEQVAFAQNGSLVNPVRMLGDGSLGGAVSADEHVEASRVKISSGRAANIAWAVMDEGVKARVDLPFSTNTAGVASNSANLGAASRASLESIEAAYDPDSSEPEKYVSTASSGLGLGKEMGKYTHDLTVWSKGPITNVVEGGLREDLNLLADRSALPPEFAGRRIYVNSTSGLAPSDPYWQHVYEYARLYRNMRKVNGKPEVDVAVPAGYNSRAWNPSIGAIVANKNPPNGMVLAPTIAKVQVAFSLVARRAHGGWGNTIRNTTGDSQRQYMLHMIFSPIVTIHNPYNVALKFDRLRLQFQNVPIAFKFYRNGQAQTHGFHPLNQLYVYLDSNGNSQKSFAMTIQGTGSNGQPDPLAGVTLKPGEVRVFSPYMPPGYTWAKDRPGDGSFYFDWRNDKTSNIQGVPGWRGEGIGFDIDWLTPRPGLTSNDDQMGVISMRWNDRIKVEYQPYAVVPAKNRFSIVTALYQGSKLSYVGNVDMAYGSDNDLKNLLPAPQGKQYQFPQAGEADMTCSSIYEADNTQISAYDHAKSFCMFSAYAKTAKGGTAGDKDGRYATKAWSFTNPTGNITSVDLKKEHGSHHSHEMNFEPMPGNPDTQIQVDGNDRGNFITGHTSLHGLKFGTHNELPIAPLQSVANLQNANLASSGYAPRFDYPLGNSMAHPLMSSGSVRENSATGDVMLDHSYLLNHHLFDRFYCSNVCAYQGAMFSASRDTNQVFNDFATNQKPLLDRRLTFWQPSNKSLTQITSDVTGGDGYKNIAAYQMMRGEWNVNSVSKDAWKAMLSGLNHSDFPIYDALLDTITNRQYSKNPLSRFRLPNGKAATGGSNGGTVNDRRSRWTGYVELKEDEVDALAEEIVKEVRARGPFLSLSEFVNRRLSGNQELQLAGALQAAVDRTTINDRVAPDGLTITPAMVANYKLNNVAAATGSSTAGAPGSVTQGHILNAMGNAVTVRSNTFTIRAFGESLNADGTVAARAWCEAVVQRIPEYLDPTDSAEVKTSALSSLVNQNFGRRIRIVSFRWLGDEEV
ncbi:MAG: hypothetical protein ACPG32_03205 [Akkermansiaceae bacterium]